MSGLSSAFDVGTKGYGGFTGRTVIMAIVGGTASRLGGGKFANGAVSAAFVHMYNAMSHPTYPSKENFIEGFTKDVSRAFRALSLMVRSQGFEARGLPSLSYSQAYDIVLAQEKIGGKVGDIIGFGLSVGSAINPAGLGVRMGIFALGIDVVQGDIAGGIFGFGAMFSNYAVPIDLAYGACRTSSSCSAALDDILK